MQKSNLRGPLADAMPGVIAAINRFPSRENFVLAAISEHDALRELNISRAQVYTPYTGIIPPD
jgi:hypothetical protein